MYYVMMLKKLGAFALPDIVENAEAGLFASVNDLTPTALLLL